MEITPTILGQTAAQVYQQTQSLVGLTSKVHLDVADGLFVPETSPVNVGELIVPSFQYDLHLMVSDPTLFVPVLHRVEIGTVYVHAELSSHALHHFFELAHEIPVRIGLVLNLETAISVLDQFEGRFRSILLMSIVPGASGRPFDPRVMARIHEVRHRYRDSTIAVDGGVNAETIPLIKGADEAMVHHAIFTGNIANADSLVALRTLALQHS